MNTVMRSVRQAVGANWTKVIALVFLACFVLCGVLAPYLAPHHPNAQNLLLRLRPPVFSAHHAAGYLLGTDSLGRDVFSRVIYGSRISFMVGVSAALISGVLGSTIGLTAGFFGRAWDQIAMRIADIQLAFPSILLALAIVSVVGPGLGHLILVLGFTGWVSYARVIRSEVLSLKTRDYIMASRIAGAGNGRILLRHILPNVIGPVITIGTFQVASAIIAEAALSFLGLGVPISTPSWGSMLSEGQLYVASAWWIATVPGVCIMFTVLSINILGDLISDMMNPQSRDGLTQNKRPTGLKKGIQGILKGVQG
jgi:peptide/nickel transport system permease protein